MSNTADKCVGMKGNEVTELATRVVNLAWFTKVAFDEFP